VCDIPVSVGAGLLIGLLIRNKKYILLSMNENTFSTTWTKLKRILKKVRTEDKKCHTKTIMSIKTDGVPK
jgi:hypothetical protein